MNYYIIYIGKKNNRVGWHFAFGPRSQEPGLSCLAWIGELPSPIYLTLLLLSFVYFIYFFLVYTHSLRVCFLWFRRYFLSTKLYAVFEDDAGREK